METRPQNAAAAAGATSTWRPGNYLLPLLVLALALVPLAACGFSFGSAENGGWRELAELLHNRAHLQSLGTLLLVSLLMAFAITVVAMFAGYAISRVSGRAARRGAGTVALTALFGAMLLLPLYLQASASGALHRDVAFLLVYALLTLPFCTWRLKLAADAVSSVMLDAARLDGCSAVQTFRLILRPSLNRAVLLSAIFSFVSAWNFIVLRELHTRPGIAAAMLSLSIPLLIVFLVLNREPARA